MRRLDEVYTDLARSGGPARRDSHGQRRGGRGLATRGVPRIVGLSMVSAPLRVVLFWMLGGVLFGPLTALFAQPRLATPAPLMGKASEPPPGDAVTALATAQRALEMGFPSAAVDLFRRALAHPAMQGDVRNHVVLAWVTALMDDGRLAEAEQALTEFKGPPTPGYHLKAGLIAAGNRKWDAARAAAAAIKEETLLNADVAWWHFLQGAVAFGTAPDIGLGAAAASPHYERAVKALDDKPAYATQRAHLLLAQQQMELLMGQNFANEKVVRDARQELEKNQGNSTGYRAVRNLAVAHHGLGQRDAAIGLLQQQLRGLPREERQVRDEWSLLLGMIADPSEGVGRVQLLSLVATGTDRAKQQAALVLLSRHSPDGRRRQELRSKLTELIQAPTRHPLLEELLLFRAQTALLDRDNLAAEEDASLLVEQFPGSLLKKAALVVKTNSAWDAGRFRNATRFATEARAAHEPGEVHAQLGVLIAEAFFRTGLSSQETSDFRNAADAYAAALREVPPGVKAGALMFQRVESEIRAGRLDEAQSLLDSLAQDPRLDVTNRWHAESNLVRALQGNGKTQAAFDRVNRLLQTSAGGGLSAELRVRMAWLQARLSYDIGDYPRTLALTEALLAPQEGIASELQKEITSNTLLLQAQANFALDQPERNATAVQLLKTLRSEHPSSSAASYSYIAEATAEAKKGRFDNARRLLLELADADKQRNNAYVPYALYQAALYDAQIEKYHEANINLERLVTDYPRSELVFYARMTQGDVFRNRGDFGYAEAAYNAARKAFPQHKEIAAAELALADCHNFQAANDAGHRELASQGYLHLYETATAPIDRRIEAGFKYGLLLDGHGRSADAQAAWVGLVAQFLGADDTVSSLSAAGRYFLSKTLAYLGDSYAKAGKLEQARQAYNRILTKQLPGTEEVRERLQRVQPGAPKS